MSEAKFKFKKLRAITLELLKPKVGEEIYVKFDAPIELAKDTRSPEQLAKDPDKDTPPHVTKITNLVTGEQNELIVPAVLLSELTDACPDDSYIGKCFAITKLPKREGKRYFPYRILEIEVETETKAKK